MIKKSVFTRLAAAVLALLMLLSGICVNAADTYTRAELDRFGENIRLLSSFDLIENTSKQAATTITRSEFAAVMMKYLGYAQTSYEGTLFSDVPDRNSPVYGLVQMGLINGNPGGDFRPDDDILVEEALKPLVISLGYYPRVENLGGYPGGYIICAKDIGVLRNVQIGQGMILTYINLTQMLTNALTTDLMQNDLSGKKDSYSVESGNTWLKNRLRAEKRHGIVTAAQGLSVNESGVTAKNSLTVDGVLYDIDGDYSYLIGSNITFYVNNDNAILHIEENNTESLVFGASQILGYADRTYTVENGDDTDGKKYRLSQGAYILYNGAFADSITAEEMCPKYGSITLTDNNNDGHYDTVKIESFAVYVVKSLSDAQSKIYTDSADKTVLDFGGIDSEDLTIGDSSGRQLEFAEIPANSVIRVGFSKTREKAKIIVSTENVTGAVTEINSDERVKTVYIDGVPYKTVSELIDNKEIYVGMSNTFSLDCEGWITALLEDDTSYSYGYLDAAIIKSVDETLQTKIFSDSGKMLYLDGAPRIDIDGLKKQTGAQTLELLKKGTGSVVKQIIRFKLNGAGKIKEIDTPYNSKSNISAKPVNGESEDSLRLIYTGSIRYYKALHNFSGKLNVDAGTPIINVVGSREEDYNVKHIVNLSDNVSYPIEAYSDDENSRFAKVIFSDSRSFSGGSGANPLIGVVTDVMPALDSDGETVTKFCFQSKNKYVELLMDTKLASKFPYNAANEKIYSIEVGDVLAVKYSGDTADEVAMLYKRSENLFPAGTSYGTFIDSRIHYTFGNVYSYNKGFIDVTSVDILSGNVPLSGDLVSYYLSAFPNIYKYTEDGRKPRITKILPSEIIDFKTGGAECSRVFIADEYEYPNMIIVY